MIVLVLLLLVGAAVASTFALPAIIYLALRK